jgi:hypothetical protein
MIDEKNKNKNLIPRAGECWAVWGWVGEIGWGDRYEGV